MSPGHRGQRSISHITHSASFHSLSLSFLFLFSKNRKRTHDGSAPNLHSTPHFQARSQAAPPHCTEKRREGELHIWSPHAACSPLSTHRRATEGRGPTAEIRKFRWALLLVSPDNDTHVSPWGFDWWIMRMPQREQLCLFEHLLCIWHFVKLLAFHQLTLTTTDQCKFLIISEGTEFRRG